MKIREVIAYKNYFEDFDIVEKGLEGKVKILIEA